MGAARTTQPSKGAVRLRLSMWQWGGLSREDDRAVDGL